MKLIYLISFFILVFFCTSCRTDCIHYGKGSSNELINNSVAGYGSTSDSSFIYEYYLVFTNYKNNSFSIDYFVKMSELFLDTLKTDNPVGDIIILGQFPGKCIPDIEKDQKKTENFGILTIGFTVPNSKNNLRDVLYIRQWTKGKYGSKIYFPNQSVRDSIMGLKVDNKL